MVPRLNELDDADEMIFGTAARMSKVTDTWFITVPNGFYDVKVTLKLVKNIRNMQK